MGIVQLVIFCCLYYIPNNSKLSHYELKRHEKSNYRMNFIFKEYYGEMGGGAKLSSLDKTSTKNFLC